MTERYALGAVRIAAIALLHGAQAQAQANEPRPIPVRQLGRVVSSDSTILMGIASVRQLPNGGVIVNDATRRQLVVFDSTLSKHTVIADTSTNSPNSYGLRGSLGGLVPYVGDSTIFVDRVASISGDR